MTINQMRAFILSEYPNASLTWKNKVMFKMRPAQVIAIYKNIQNRRSNPLGKFLHDRGMMCYKNEDGTIHTCGKPDEEEYHQMDIFEWAAELNSTSDVPGNHTEVEVSTQ